MAASSVLRVYRGVVFGASALGLDIVRPSPAPDPLSSRIYSKSSNKNRGD